MLASFDYLSDSCSERFFELHASGTHSLSSLRKGIRSETGFHIARSYLEALLKNRFYLRFFCWQGVEYKGSHKPLIEATLFGRVEDVFTGRNRGKRCKHEFAVLPACSPAHTTDAP